MAYGVLPRVVFRGSDAKSNLILVSGTASNGKFIVKREEMETRQNQILATLIKTVTIFQFFLNQQPNPPSIKLSIAAFENLGFTDVDALTDFEYNSDPKTITIKCMNPELGNVKSHVMLMDENEQKETKLLYTSKYKCSVTHFNLASAPATIYFSTSKISNPDQSNLLLSCLIKRCAGQADDSVTLFIDDVFENTKSLFDFVALLRLELNKKICKIETRKLGTRGGLANEFLQCLGVVDTACTGTQLTIEIKTYPEVETLIMRKITAGAPLRLAPVFSLPIKDTSAPVFETLLPVPADMDAQKAMAIASFYYEAFKAPKFYE